MAQYRPLVRANGRTVGLPSGDTLEQTTLPLAWLTVPYAPVVTLDVAAYDLFQIAPLTGDIAVQFTHAAPGLSGEVWVQQDLAGARRVNWRQPSGYLLYAESAAQLDASPTPEVTTRFRYAFFALGGAMYLDVEGSVRAQMPDGVVRSGSRVMYGALRVVVAPLAVRRGADQVRYGTRRVIRQVAW